MLRWRGCHRFAAVAAAVFASPLAALAQGIFLPSAGAVNSGMAGASTAVAVDAAGASYWNPATIRALKRSEVYFGVQGVYADTNLSSTLEAGAIGGVFPATTQHGANNSNSGLSALPVASMVYQPDDSFLTYGFSFFTLGAGGVNFPGNANNPVLAPNNPPPPLNANTSFGVGPIYSSAVVFQIAPLVSAQLTDRLAIGAGPTADVMLLSIAPAFFAPPDDANGDGIGNFPAATNGRPFWGGGYQVGLLYGLGPSFDVGFSYKSPQWFGRPEWNSSDETGAAREVTRDLRLPYILSLGFGYRGIARTVLAADVRYFDYAGATPFGIPTSQGGLTWDSIFAVALGVRHHLTNRVHLTAGYLFNENPVPDAVTQYNVQSPAINRHTLFVGGSLQLAPPIRLDIAAAHGFRESISGPIEQVPGMTVTVDQNVTALIAGLTVTFR